MISLTKSLLALPLAGALLLSGCAAMQAQYDASLDNAVTVAPVDQVAYTQVAVDAFACSESGHPCPMQMGQMASDQLAMTLSRLGYQVFDTAQFQAWLVTPPTVMVATGPPSLDMSIGPNGVSISANDGYEEVSAYSGPDGVYVGGGPGYVVYESLPIESRQVIIEQSGIRGVVTGRIMVAPPDSTTGWQEVHVLIRLGDAQTGALIWQGEWREEAMDSETPEQALQEAMQHLERALERKQPLRPATY